MPNAPRSETLRRYSSKSDPKWPELREQYRLQAITETTDRISRLTKEFQEHKLYDAVETVKRHLKIAKLIQLKLLQRLQKLDPEEIKPADIPNWLKVTTEIERLALGLATAHVKTDVTSNGQPLQPHKIEIVAPAIAQAQTQATDNAPTLEATVAAMEAEADAEVEAGNDEFLY